MIASASGTAFLEVIEARAIPFLFERSIKISPRGVSIDRFLASFERRRFGIEDDTSSREITRLTADLGFPATAGVWLRQNALGAQAVHFGFEANAAHVTRKVYWEYIGDARHAMALPDGPPSPVVVHRAAKWDATTGVLRETYYEILPSAGLTLDERLAARKLPGTGLEFVIDMVRSILAEALRRAPATDFVLLEVRDLGTRRRSFDLQIYDAMLTARQIQLHLDMLLASFGVAESLIAGMLPAHAKVGHIGGGLDVSGCAFATIYFS